MPCICITVKNKVSVGDKSRIVCGNSDYVANFYFDEEWDAYYVKTARFIPAGTPHKYTDVVFSGATCPVPVLNDTIGVFVGVYAGDLHTTTPAWFECDKSILCGGGIPDAPVDDVYAQIMELLNGLNQDIGQAVSDYLKENPIEGTTFTTDETLSLDPETKVMSVNTADAAEQDNTLPITAAAVYTTIGNIEVLLGTI